MGSKLRKKNRNKKPSIINTDRVMQSIDTYKQDVYAYTCSKANLIMSVLALHDVFNFSPTDAEKFVQGLCRVSNNSQTLPELERLVKFYYPRLSYEVSDSVDEDINMSEPKEYEFCLRCGRKLKNPEHRRIGYGPICLEKSKTNSSKLFSSNLVDRTNKV